MTIAARMAPERIAEIRRLYLERDPDGTPSHKVESIASAVGTSQDQVGKHCADLPRRKPHLEKQRLAVIELASLDILGLGEIAKQAGCTINFAREALAKTPDT